MLETLNQCPLCNSGHFNKFLTCEDFAVSKETFTLVSCDNCDFVFTNPRPAPEQLSQYYQSKDYISHRNKSTNPINFLYKLARSFTIAQKVKLVNTLSNDNSILDIGCGTGHFLKACQTSGWKINGVEPDPTARNIAEAKTGTRLTESVNDITDTSFNVITLWHVLEHIPDLNTFINQLTSLLERNGVLIIAVPNHKSYDALRYKTYWAGYDVPRHLYHFDKNSMQQLVSKHRLRLDDIIPMRLDAYYVSLLSETYKNNNPLKYIRSLTTGCKSNRYATKNENNYSSLIYIIRFENA